MTAIDAVLADGSEARFGPVPANLDGIAGPQRLIDLVQRLRALAAREKDEIRQRFPDLLRRVGGYNIDALLPGGPGAQLGNRAARLLVGSEGNQAAKDLLEFIASEEGQRICKTTGLI